MAEMDGLKKRVELIDLRLKSAHSARERETAALMETWDLIRSRFQDQSAEIVKLRSQISDLEDARNDLLKMVHGLLEAVEGGLDSMADETVPQIKNMAEQLLANSRADVGASRTPMPSAISEDGPEDEGSDYEPDQDSDTISGDAAAEPSFHANLMTAIERTIDGTDQDDYVNGASRPNISDVVSQTDRGETASPGIRNLVARIEKAVGEDFLDPTSPSDDSANESDDDLTRDLQEIEALRDELNGLRHRIAAGAI
jgi:hypothetical protein